MSLVGCTEPLDPLIGPFEDSNGDPRYFAHQTCTVWASEVYEDDGVLQKVTQAIERGKGLVFAALSPFSRALGFSSPPPRSTDVQQMPAPRRSHRLSRAHVSPHVPCEVCRAGQRAVPTSGREGRDRGISTIRCERVI
jgi:hypothetical protein